ncbi:hypothetical protein ACFFNY_07995 [Paenibacillus hodogayensis]|uniref:Secreted peptide n=1 Tax=Paenibacillus hodogayensis TaxID=279208 RepID=A0ABV5VTS0_9BACL
MIASRALHIHLKLIVTFALLWSFLMPTIETVVTPVSSSIPAVSSAAAGCCIASTVGQSIEKPEEAVAFTVFALLLFPLRRIVTALRLRTTRAIPLLMKSLLLRPIKFTSNYVSV